MDEKRKQEADQNVSEYLRTGLLKKIEFDKQIFDVYLKNSYESLDMAKMIINSKRSNLWIVVTSYLEEFPKTHDFSRGMSIQKLFGITSSNKPPTLVGGNQGRYDYSMFYIANALLYKLGYKVGDKISHKVTADALIVFGRKTINEALIDDLQNAMKDAMDLEGKTDDLMENFDRERSKRSKFQYKMPEEAKERHAKTSFCRATNFSFELTKVLNAMKTSRKL